MEVPVGENRRQRHAAGDAPAAGGWRPVLGGGRGRWGVRLALGLVLLVVVLLAVSQAVLPGLAAQRVRDLMKPYGGVEHVAVSAFPALELLWGKADHASATARALTLSEQQAMKLTWEGRGVRNTDLRVAALTLRIPGLPAGMVLHDVVVRKRGDLISTEGTLRQADIDRASPAGFHLQLLPSEAGTVRVSASGSLFGIAATVEALAAAQEGRLVAQPLNIPFGQFISLTLFSDPHVHLDRVYVVPLQGGPPGSWRLALSAHLH